tara:strand:- start:62 stop:220 length:159 start_codon:yes stop_codon:yes gene_type:complete
MKLKSKDEITIKLIEKLEQHQNCDRNDIGERVELDGAINMLKWVLGIGEVNE